MRCGCDLLAVARHPFVGFFRATKCPTPADALHVWQNSALYSSLQICWGATVEHVWKGFAPAPERFRSPVVYDNGHESWDDRCHRLIERSNERTCHSPTYQREPWLSRYSGKLLGRASASSHALRAWFHSRDHRYDRHSHWPSWRICKDLYCVEIYFTCV